MKIKIGTRKIVEYSLLALTMVCIYIILCIGLGWFWKIGHIENAEKVNAVLINLSYNYMAAFVFFILIEYIPKRISSKKAFLIWKSKLVTIYMYMSNIISPLKMIVDIQKKDSEISLQELAEICNYTPAYEKIYYSSTIHLSNKGNNGVTKEIFRFHKDLSDLSETIKNKIEDIIKLPSTPNIDIELVEIISAIYSSEFLQTCSSFREYKRNGQNYPIHKFDKNFYDFIKLHERLGKFDFIKCSYTYKRLTEEEIVQVIAEKKEKWREIQRLNIIQNDALIYFNNIQYKIENGVLVE